MNIAVSIISLLFLLSLPQFASGQQKQASKTRKIPYIEVVRCVKCNDVAIQLPRPKYPSMVGTGPHVYNGEIGVQIVIDEQGQVEKATAISGHPFFRHMLEQESLKATFRPTILEGKAYKNTGVIVYHVISRKTDEKVERILPVVNGLAKNLPKPDYPKNAKSSCAKGRVEVEVSINKAGNVVDAKGVSGNSLLFGSATSAAKMAKFSHPVDLPRIAQRGILVYNFQSPSGCPVR